MTVFATDLTGVPAVIISGSPGEADRFIVAALWTGEEPTPTINAVTKWASVLRERGVEFASHASACHYWLSEQMAIKAGRPPLRPYPK